VAGAAADTDTADEVEDDVLGGDARPERAGDVDLVRILLSPCTLPS
jgi:hypothetical protein